MINKTLLCAGLMTILSGSAQAETISNTAANTVTSFEQLFGVTQGKRRNHTKGFCFEAVFVPADGVIRELSGSSLFQSESRVIGRFSHKGGNNNAPDDQPSELGMGLAFETAAGESHLMALNTLDFFPVATPEAFAELMRAKVQGKEAVKAFKNSNQDLQRFKKHEAAKGKQVRTYEDATYNSVNAFYLINKEGAKTAVRWSFVPTSMHGVVVEPAENFLLENIETNLQNKEIAWNMMVSIAVDGDDINNASIPWPADRKKVIAGTLKLERVMSEAKGKCDAINFDPLVLSKGFAASNDPLLQARRAAYAISFGKRTLEKQKAASNRP